MKKEKYNIYWSDQDNAFVAEVPCMPGCVSHGSTREEAESNIQEAMELWLECEKKHNNIVVEHKGRSIEQIKRDIKLLKDRVAKDMRKFYK